MKSPLGLVIVLAAATAAWGQVAWPGLLTPWSGTPSFPSSPPAGAVHPAVVRVVVPDRDRATSLGSGALVAVTDQHGLVVTNWHVVRDAAGPIVIYFPDGFRSGATLLKTDRDWDLAALAIWRPYATPIPLAAEPPRPGEPLAIAGYGSGQYRLIAGRCTQYVAPARNQPFEMVELSAPARQGDSGGPILNGRGELAGVLFGTSGGSTTGSYCGRVRWFLTSVIDDFQRLQPSSIMIAQQPAVDPRPAVPRQQMGQYPAGQYPAGQYPPGQYPGGRTAAVQAVANTPQTSPVSPSRGPAAAVAAFGSVEPARVPPAQQPGQAPADPRIAASPPAKAPSAPTASLTGPSPTGPSDVDEAGLWDLTRNVLALVGAMAIFFHAVRLLTINQGPSGRK